MDEARRFLDRVDTDPALQAKLEAVGWNATQASAIAAAAGFTATAAELEAASAARYGQLSDSALDKVAGGGAIVEQARGIPKPNAMVPDGLPKPNIMVPDGMPKPNVMIPD